MNRIGTVAVLMGGDSSEREVSLRSGKAVLKALQGKGHQVFAIDVRDDLERLVSADYDRAFIALHGRRGEDGSIQGMLEMIGIPYTGSGILASAATMDKVFAKIIMESKGIRTPAYQVFNNCVSSKGGGLRLDFPVIVKPSSEGSTIGVKRVEGNDDLWDAIGAALSFGRKVLVERFVEGREVTVSILDGEALPIVEVIPKEGFYDFNAKYTMGMTDYVVPARLDAENSSEISRMAVEVYRLFGCRGAARVDFILGGDGPSVLEINTIPGMTRTSLLPMAAKEAGLSFEDLVERMLKGAELDGGSADYAAAAGS